MLFAQSQSSTEDLSQLYGWVGNNGQTIILYTIRADTNRIKEND
jgi:hypothetical protein